MSLFEVERIARSGDASQLIEYANRPEVAESPRKRRNLVGSLRSIRAVEVTDLLVSYLSDPDEQVRALSAAALEGRRDPSVEAALISAASSEPAMVNAAAVKSLGSAGSFRCIPELEKIAWNGDRGLKARAVTALESIGGSDAVDALVRLLSSDDPYIRLCAVTALDGIGDSRAVEPIESRIEGETRFNQAAFRFAVKTMRARK